MARKQLTREEKAARLQARAEALLSGNVREIKTIQLPFADYLSNDADGLSVVQFPKKVKDMRYYVHVQHEGEKFKVWLRPSTSGSGLPIPPSARPRVEFPSGVAWKDSTPSYFGTVSTESEGHKGASLVIGLIAKEMHATSQKNAELEKALAEQTKKGKPANK